MRWTEPTVQNALNNFPPLMVWTLHLPIAVRHWTLTQNPISLKVRFISALSYA